MRTTCCRFFLLVLSVAFMLPVSSSLRAEEEQKADNRSGYYGIYVDDAKVGYVKWDFRYMDKLAGTAEGYRIKWNESYSAYRRGKVTEEVYNYTGMVSLAYAPLTLECNIDRLSGKATIKGKGRKDSVSISIKFGDKKPMRGQPLKTPPGATWAFCAPLLFALQSTGKAAPKELIRIIEMNKIVRKATLKPKKAKLKISGEEKDVTEWKSSKGDIALYANTDGELLKFYERYSWGEEKEYIAETEEVAKSPFNYRAFQNVKAGKPAFEIKRPQNLTQGERKSFAKALKPVAKSAKVSFIGNYLKIPGICSIKAEKGWQTITVGERNDDGDLAVTALVIFQKKDDRNYLWIEFASNVELKLPQTPTLDQFAKCIEKYEENDFRYFFFEETLQEYAWEGGRAWGAMAQYGVDTAKMRGFVFTYLPDNDPFFYIMLPIVRKKYWSKLESNFLRMMGSFRFEPPVE